MVDETDLANFRLRAACKIRRILSVAGGSKLPGMCETVLPTGARIVEYY